MTETLDRSRTIEVNRLIDAPRELVFKMLTDASHLDQWWGPNGFKTETHEMEFAVGGLWRYTMHGPDGKDWPNWIRYKEITPPTGIRYDHGDETDEPALFEGFISLKSEGDKTRITITLLFPTIEARDATIEFGAVEGGRQTLARLDAFVTGPQTQA
ncbi:SRPBCC domain-containing protein [Neorhizobium sp. T786]|uniref:SRPBCC domain-containing protein n=1 Tax=Pseudorhizobium xiangyangii TaxID=2883104 RepID=UPI001CFFD0DF|nr:SRPBCC domain-containing protein [Neorhizobium xiangyangii]MCB5201387.1 SRPBCC domain-containing protein [Neorhizobium xiangyangii]